MSTISPLPVPGPAADSALFTDADRSRLRVWIDALPGANPRSCGEELLEALHSSNRAPLRRMERLQLAESLRHPVYETAEALARQFARKPLPLSIEEEALSRLVRGLYGELGNAYKLAVNEVCGRPRPGVADRAQFQLATQRAILALGRDLLEYYRVYAPEEATLWGDLHLLYLNAEREKVQALPIEGQPDAEETSLSIKQAYLRTVILALSNPFHLALGEAEELYRRLGRWVHFVRVSIPETPRQQLGRFVLDLDSDLPPRFATRQHRQLPARNPRVLEPEELVRVLNEQLAKLDETIAGQNSGHTFSERMQRDMYRRFVGALGGRQERHAAREPNLAKLRMIDGLSGCHYMLNDAREFVPEQDERRWQEKVEQAVTPEPKLELASDDSYLSTDARSSARRSRFRGHDADADDVWAQPLRPKSQSDDNVPTVNTYRAEVWSRKNQSDGGMALFCQAGCRMRTRVGEIVAWSESPLPQPPGTAWRVGVIRWLRTRPNGGIELGIQKLAETGFAIGCKAVSGTGVGAEYMRGLILPRVNPLIEPATLVAPAGVFDIGSVLRLNLQDLVITVKLTERLESTRQFTRFRFQPRQSAQDA